MIKQSFFLRHERRVGLSHSRLTFVSRLIEEKAGSFPNCTDPRKNNDAKCVDPADASHFRPAAATFLIRDPSKLPSFQGTGVKWTYRNIFTVPFQPSNWLDLNRIRDVDVERDHWRLDTLDDRLITSFERNARDELIRR